MVGRACDGSLVGSRGQFGDVEVPGSMRTATVALAQGAYDLATAVWPLLSMRSFIAVTGPKTDLWLVRSLGALIGVIGATLFVAGARRRIAPEIRLLAVGSALGLGGIDVIYVARGRIRRIYLADALAQLAFIAAWALRSIRRG